MSYPTQSVDFENSSSQYASVADTAVLDLTTAFTMEGWVNFESFPTTNNDFGFLAKWYTGASQRSYRFGLQDSSGTKTLSCSVSSAGSSTQFNTSNTWTPSADTWHHIALTWSAGSYQFWVDNSSFGSGTTGSVTSLFNSTQALVMGANESTSPARLFDGKMSLWRLWSVARTQSQINDNKCTVLGATTGLVGEWVLDGNFNDNSGNSLNMTGVNSPVFVSDIPGVCMPPFNPAIPRRRLLV